MKAKLIYEKFTEDSDPIYDLGIGIYVRRDFNDVDKFINFLLMAIPYIIGQPIPKNILKGPGIIRSDLYDMITEYLKKYIYFDGRNVAHIYLSCRNIKYASSINSGTWNVILAEKLLSIGYKR